MFWLVKSALCLFFLQNAYEYSLQSRKAERHKKDNAHDSGSRRGPVRICVVGGEGQEAVRTSWKRMALGAESVEAHRSRILGFFFVLFLVWSRSGVEEVHRIVKRRAKIALDTLRCQKRDTRDGTAKTVKRRQLFFFLGLSYFSVPIEETRSQEGCRKRRRSWRPLVRF